MEGLTYAQAIAALRQAYAEGKAGLQPIFMTTEGTALARPLTFEETIDTLVNAYESGDKTLLRSWNDTCTGIHAKAHSTQFKLVPCSPALITLPEDFNQKALSLPYQDTEGIELDKSKGKYDKRLTKTEYLNHAGWTAAIPDKALRQAFGNIVFTELKTEKALGFFVRPNTSQDELRSLLVGSINDDSSATGYPLRSKARFVRVNPT